MFAHIFQRGVALSRPSLAPPVGSSVAFKQAICQSFVRHLHKSCGLVGYPNVGKSTLFNALTRTQLAQAANYPFCTIEPNVAKVAVHDNRLKQLAEKAKSANVIYGQLEFVDIAGLIKGASQGAGLGNMFLSNIRNVAVILHVIRCFEDSNIIHVDNMTDLDPLKELDIVRTELLLADLETASKRYDSASKRCKSGDRDSLMIAPVLKKVLAMLEQGRPARDADLGDDEKTLFESLQLLTGKPVVHICNVDPSAAGKGNKMSERVKEYVAKEGGEALVISAKLEDEAANFYNSASSETEAKALQKEYLQAYGLEETGLDRVTQICSRLLDLNCYYTIGPKEARSWFFRRGACAPEAAGKIHSDFEKGFICAEVSKFDDWMTHGSESALKGAGKIVRQGRTYVVEDGDIMLFRHNVTNAGGAKK